MGKKHLNQPWIFVGDEFVSFQGKKCTTVPLRAHWDPTCQVEFIKQDAKVAEVWASCWVEHFAQRPGWWCWMQKKHVDMLCFLFFFLFWSFLWRYNSCMVYTYIYICFIYHKYACVLIVFISYNNTVNVYPISTSMCNYISIYFAYLHAPEHAFFKLNLTPNKKPLIFYWYPHNRLLRASIVDDLFCGLNWSGFLASRKRWHFHNKNIENKSRWQDSCLSRHTASILEGACG